MNVDVLYHDHYTLKVWSDTAECLPKFPHLSSFVLCLYYFLRAWLSRHELEGEARLEVIIVDPINPAVIIQHTKL